MATLWRMAQRWLGLVVLLAQLDQARQLLIQRRQEMTWCELALQLLVMRRLLLVLLLVLLLSLIAVLALP